MTYAVLFAVRIKNVDEHRVRFSRYVETVL
jgi:hypothetical protein